MSAQPETMSSAFQRVLHVLETQGCRPVKRGKSWFARCPAHDDQKPSLSVNEGNDGRVVLNCFADCKIGDILQHLGLRMADLHDNPKQKAVRLTLQALAEAKGFQPSFLQDLGVKDCHGKVKITYRLQDGSTKCKQRKRTAVAARDGSYWSKGKPKIVPYGLWRLGDARKTGVLILVEGESDCWTLWFHGYAALGIPGATMAHCLLAEHLEGINTLCLFQEPDQGGESFIRRMAARLNEIGWTGKVCVVTLPDGFKDPNDLHRCHLANPEAFRLAFDEALNIAAPPKLLPDRWQEFLQSPANRRIRLTVRELFKRYLNIEARQGVARGDFFPASFEVLQKATGLSLDSIANGNRTLQEMGWIYIEKGKAKGPCRKPNQVRIVPFTPELAAFHSENRAKKGKTMGNGKVVATLKTERKSGDNLAFHRSENRENVLRKRRGDSHTLSLPVACMAQDSKVAECSLVVPWDEIEAWPEEARDDFEERAAIKEFDANLPRAQAEWEAYQLTKTRLVLQLAHGGCHETCS